MEDEILSGLVSCHIIYQDMITVVVKGAAVIDICVTGTFTDTDLQQCFVFMNMIYHMIITLQ